MLIIDVAIVKLYKLCCHCSDQLSPVQQNETMHNCLETVKLANRICQRSSAVMETKVKDSESLQEVRETSKLMVEMDVCILQSGKKYLDF